MNLFTDNNNIIIVNETKLNLIKEMIDQPLQNINVH